jgi:hypothetical protein
MYVSFFSQIVYISEVHTCASTSQVKGKEATEVWIADRAKEGLEGLHGTWEDSFKMLWNFKAELEATCPGSIVEIDCKKKKDGRVYFSRMFVAIKACVDGFLAGCRPYLGVDSTHLTGKYNGQLDAATTIDGHNWMYRVAYVIF